MKFDSNGSFFTVEGGLYAYYRSPQGHPVLQYTCKRLALAYDSDAAVFERFGPPEELMHWVAERQEQLRSEGRAVEAKCLTVALLPTNIDTRELNRLEVRPDRFIYFLQKVGLV